MRALFLGSHPAIDFLNTAFAPNGEQIETIADGAEFLQWLVTAGLLDASLAKQLPRRLGAKALDAAAMEARKMREWARTWLKQWRAAPERDYKEPLAALNKLLERAEYTREVIATSSGMKLLERGQIQTADALVGLVAVQIANLLTAEQSSLIKSCAGPGCTLWFLDRTKAHRRQFCSVAACGNRAKVAAFRKRQQS